MKISFLLNNAYGVGGAIRATVSVANAMATNGHEVEILSALRGAENPAFELHHGVRLTPLADVRNVDALSPAEQESHREPPKVMPKSEAVHRDHSRFTETRVKDALSGIDTDVLIGTRMGLNTYVAAFAPDKVARVGMAHTTFSYYNAASLADELSALSRLDALVTVAVGDVPVWREQMKPHGTAVVGIPNCVGPSTLPPAQLDSKTVVAVGRLTGVKQFNLLIRAFKVVVDKYPDWKLRIYGRGKAHKALRNLIFDLGLHNNVFLMGAVTPIEPEWAKASIAAVTSRLESFHIGLVEAQQVGVPVVSMACERGPVDIIKHGKDGLLTPINDIEAFADGLLRVIEDPQLAQKLSVNARKRSRRFEPPQIAKQYDKFLTKLVRSKGGKPRPTTSASAAKNNASSTYAVDCVVSAGSETVELHVHNDSASEVVLTHDGKKRKVTRLKCQRGVARIPLTTALAEGMYDVHVNGKRGLLAARVGMLDTRGLLARNDLDAYRLAHMVPMRTDDGLLRLRSWRRAIHAEVGDVAIEGEQVTLAGRLYGEFHTDRRLQAEIVLRGTDRRIDVDCPLSPDGSFEVSVSARELVHPGTSKDPALWDVWLRLSGQVEGEGADRFRFMRVLDDIAARKKIFAYPPIPVNDARTATVVPYFTDHNGLTFRSNPTAPTNKTINLCGRE